MPRASRSSSSDSQQSSKSQGKNSKKDAKQKTEKDTWMFIMNDDALRTDQAEDSSRPTICKLRNPRMNTGVMYLMSADCTRLYELNSFKEKYRSWFVGDSVHSDGQIYITAPLDPLFLVLQYLFKASESNRFMTLDQLICDEDFPNSYKLLTCVNHDQVAFIADSKDLDDDEQVYRYSKEKTLEWLKQKVEVVADTLEEKKVNVNTKGAHSAIFIPGKGQTTSRATYMEFAFGLVCDYLSPTLEKELRDFLGLPEIKETPQMPPEVSAENEPPNKKAKLTEDVVPTEDYSGRVDLKSSKSKTGKMTAAQRKLSKVDKTGMKSLTSFFSAKS